MCVVKEACVRARGKECERGDVLCERGRQREIVCERDHLIMHTSCTHLDVHRAGSLCTACTRCGYAAQYPIHSLSVRYRTHLHSTQEEVGARTTVWYAVYAARGGPGFTFR